ncbi:MAG TPA: L,D-transpeptidase family protein [Thermoanaerobaculia bacterium]|nr:L,D-transpeptidase family protein [Thermoanaerobaculia bacterium]
MNSASPIPRLLPALLLLAPALVAGARLAPGRPSRQAPPALQPPQQQQAAPEGRAPVPQPGPQPAPQLPPPAAAIPTPAPDSAADVQTLLDRVSFSPGVIDGGWGQNSRKAIAGFQEAHDLPVTGEVDSVTWQNLLAASGGQAWAQYAITPADEKGPFFEIPDKIEELAKLPALGNRSLAEMLGGRFHTTEKLLRERNPGARFVTGETLLVPNVRTVAEGPVRGEAGGAVRIVVSKSKLTLTVDNGDDLLFSGPVSAGSEHDSLPIGEWRVRGIIRNPAFFYNPALFWDADPSHAKAKLPPGPNNPVGLVWIDLSKEHYGIHGTPNPAKIGTTFSRGCVRLTNWDALTVAALIKPGTPVLFEP